MRILIIGGGVVGQATFRTYCEHHDCSVWDVDPLRRTHSISLDFNIRYNDLVFVCVPESAIDDLFADVPEEARSRNFVLRSTVPIGTTRRLSEQYNLPNLAHSPEFLTERCSVVDAMMPTRNIIGYTNQNTVWGPGQCIHELTQLYTKRFPGAPCHLMTSDESEYVKLAQNSLFAVTVAMWNEMRELSDALNLDWERVHNAILADGRISHNHTQVPGPDGKRGFGGKCLPKDLSHFIDAQREVGVGAYLSAAAVNRNEEDRKDKS